MAKTLKAVRRGVATSPQCVDTGVKIFLKGFEDDELLCNRLASLHFNSASARLFCTGPAAVAAIMIDPHSPSHLPIIWTKSRASRYPPLASFESKEQQGIHCRGV
jgi:hypothetical protein